MTWNAFHRRGEILRTVVDTADARRDGVLPMQLPGVAETFARRARPARRPAAEVARPAVGQHRARADGEPMDLEDAVASAWLPDRDQLPGIRLVLDRYVESPNDPEMAAALDRAKEKEWCRLATAAGLANDEGPAAARVGRQIELKARSAVAHPRHRLRPPPPRISTRILPPSSTGSRRFSPPDPLPQTIPGPLPPSGPGIVLAAPAACDHASGHACHHGGHGAGHRGVSGRHPDDG